MAKDGRGPVLRMEFLERAQDEYRTEAEDQLFCVFDVLSTVRCILTCPYANMATSNVPLHCPVPSKMSCGGVVMTQMHAI